MSDNVSCRKGVHHQHLALHLHPVWLPQSSVLQFLRPVVPLPLQICQALSQPHSLLPLLTKRCPLPPVLRTLTGHLLYRWTTVWNWADAFLEKSFWWKQVLAWETAITQKSCSTLTWWKVRNLAGKLLRPVFVQSLSFQMRIQPIRERRIARTSNVQRGDLPTACRNWGACVTAQAHQQ